MHKPLWRIVPLLLIAAAALVAGGWLLGRWEAGVWNRWASAPKTVTPSATGPATSGVDIDGVHVTGQPGSSITYQTTTTEQTVGATEQRDQTASGKSAGITSSSEGAVTKFRTEAPNTALGFIHSSGGAADIRSTLTGGSAASWLAWAAVAALVGGGVAFYFGLRRAAFIAWGLAGVLFAVALYPTVVFIAVGVVAAGAVAYFVWIERKNKGHLEALRAVAAGVEAVPEHIANTVKDAIKFHADEADKAVIKAVKRADDL